MTYKIKYDLPHEIGNFSKEDIVKEGKGGADAFVFISMLYTKDGSFSMKVLSKDGSTGKEITNNDLWKVWSLLSNSLGEAEDLNEAKRKIASTAFNSLKELINNTK